MTFVTLDVENQEVKIQFMRLQKGAQHPRPVFQHMTRDFRKMMVRQFDTQGDFLDSPWAPLSEYTRKAKQRENLDPRILHATRAMRRSFTQGRAGYRQISVGAFRIGSDIPYASFHRTGTRNMPARVIFRFTPYVVKRWTKALQGYLIFGVVNLRNQGL